uniref:Uncharacterized protein n=1 Tax=Arundo donax TaxID=35708 RepID=A0A0A8YY67_ARUDO
MYIHRRFLKILSFHYSTSYLVRRAITYES